jgi:hypothetical protein
VSSDAVTLNWSASPGPDVISYVIEAGSGPGLADLASVLTRSTATTFYATGVGPGAYYVRVRAQNAGAVGQASNEIVVIVGSRSCITPPGAPAALTALVNGSSVFLSWAAATGSPTTYLVEAGSASGLSNLANSDLGPGTSFTVSGVARGTYFIRIRARNGCGTSSASNEVTTTVGRAISLAIVNLGGEFRIWQAESTYLITGHIDVTTSAPVFGVMRMALKAGELVNISQRFAAPTQMLRFDLGLITTATCPDFRGRIPLYLYDEAGSTLGSATVQFRGPGCAFNP